ncbi:MAG: biotin--[acetyl-CoA-carboxylase] ligase [Candidatus Ancillula sp.]|jgi:biotin-[acetyl-CoA-carboxylase] ligase BirA-like protein|nr:biotin--[acetyl-CoA-carboxylase] ligase [Candidatus Ancillula sp.]
MNIFEFEQVDSTQNILRNWFRKNDRRFFDGAVVIANHQTSGKGRNGHNWEDCESKSLLMSVVVSIPDDEYNRRNLSVISFQAGVSVVQSLNTIFGNKLSSSQKFGIKWPNDIIFKNNEKYYKIAGLISEFIGERDSRLWCSVGVGINLFQEKDELPKQTSIPAASLGMFFDLIDFKKIELINYFTEDLSKKIYEFDIEKIRFSFEKLWFKPELIKVNEIIGVPIGLGEELELFVKNQDNSNMFPVIADDTEIIEW